MSLPTSEIKSIMDLTRTCTDSYNARSDTAQCIINKRFDANAAKITFESKEIKAVLENSYNTNVADIVSQFNAEKNSIAEREGNAKTQLSKATSDKEIKLAEIRSHTAKIADIEKEIQTIDAKVEEWSKQEKENEALRKTKFDHAQKARAENTTTFTSKLKATEDAAVISLAKNEEERKSALASEALDAMPDETQVEFVEKLIEIWENIPDFYNHADDIANAFDASLETLSTDRPDFCLCDDARDAFDAFEYKSLKRKQAARRNGKRKRANSIAGNLHAHLGVREGE